MSLVKYGAGKLQASITPKTDKEGKKTVASKPLPKKK